MHLTTSVCRVAQEESGNRLLVPEFVFLRGNEVVKYAATIISASLILASVVAASAQTKGDWVLGNYQGQGYWYPGVVQGVDGGNITVLYDDGDIETLSGSAVRPYDWMIGMSVECNFQNQGEWYPGTIASLAGESIGIAYDDGDRETTKTGRCRAR